MNEPYYTIAEVVKKGLIFGYKRSSIYKFIISGELQAIEKVDGSVRKKYFISESAINNFINKNFKSNDGNPEHKETELV